MPHPGLSLLGFMNQDQALQHLKSACLPTNNSDAALIAEWQAAQIKLGAPIPRAGHPEIKDLPSHLQVKSALLAAQPWFMQAQMTMPMQFKMIEIDPLLAFQFTVNTGQSKNHCSHLGQPPVDEELFDVCLPVQMPNDTFDYQVQPQSLILKSKSLNIRTQAQGLLNPSLAGIAFGPGLPLVHVVRHQGLCYLHNGFHRSYGCRLAGATHIPCVFRDVQTIEEIGIRTDGGTFPHQLMTSSNPPTVGHYTQSRACSVTLRELYKVMHISWSEYTLTND